MLFPATPRPRLLRVGLVMPAALCLLAIIAAGCGSPATAQTTVDASSTEGSLSTTDAELFDSSVVHEIAVTFAQEDYDAMIQTYQETGEKDWIEATVTIDGDIYQNVGVRLKGNSSIMRLGGGGMDRMGGPRGTDQNGLTDTTGSTAGAAATTEASAPRTAGTETTTTAGTDPQSRQGFRQAVRGVGGNASADAPETLPWLIDLDRNVDNQNHGGTSELVVRSNTTESALNEAVALRLLERAGLASEDATYVRFSVNGSEDVLKLVIENPDDAWMAENFDITGALYKAESTGDYSYRGDDPKSYDEVFDQEAGKKNADLTPLIEFLDFINNADDDTFTEELPDRLDIEAFMTYLAVQELIANSDDIDGMGNNSYLYYDTKTKRFTVVAWDHNLAFGMMSGAGGLGGGAVAPGMPDEGFNGRIPEGMQPSTGEQPSQGVQKPENVQLPEHAGGQPGVGRNFRGRSNILVERFMANSEWKQQYEERLAELTAELYKSGVAADVLDEWVTLLKTQAADVIDLATVDQEASAISEYIAAE